MNAARVTAEAYIDFLVASPRTVSATEAARVQPEDRPISHDSFTRLLHRLEPDPATLWQEASGQVERTQGLLVLDDSTLDKPYAQHMELLTRHWSGKHRAVVQGINLLTLLWTNGERIVPVDYRLYDKAQDGLSKNDHFRQVLDTARERGFSPSCVVFDSWYASLDNLKKVRHMGWHWLTQLKKNRRVNPDGGKPEAVSDWAARTPIGPEGVVVHLVGYGPIRLFRLATPHGATAEPTTNETMATAETTTTERYEYWASSLESLSAEQRAEWAKQAWAIETYHRGIKQFCGIERAQVRAAKAQRNHIGCALRAFLRLEYQRFSFGRSWWESKHEIIRNAVRIYLTAPLYQLPKATA
jgi:hypothetical protein